MEIKVIEAQAQAQGEYQQSLRKIKQEARERENSLLHEIEVHSVTLCLIFLLHFFRNCGIRYRDWRKEEHGERMSLRRKWMSCASVAKKQRAEMKAWQLLLRNPQRLSYAKLSPFVKLARHNKRHGTALSKSLLLQAPMVFTSV